MNGTRFAKASPAAARIIGGDAAIDPDSKPGELALLLIRLLRSLDCVAGSDKRLRHAWMRSQNDALGGTPAFLIQRLDGLVATVDYLDTIHACT